MMKKVLIALFCISVIVELQAQNQDLRECLKSDDLDVFLDQHTADISSVVLSDAIRYEAWDIFSHLIKDINYINAYDSSGNTPLLTSIRLKNIKMTQALLDAGADVNLPQKGGLMGSPLMYASSNPNPELANLLLNSGAKINDIDDNGDPALNWATYYGNTAVMKLLITKGADLSLRSKHGTAVDVGFRLWHADSVTGIFKNHMTSGLSDGEEKLIRSVVSNDLKSVQKLIKKGASVDARDQLGSSILHMAIERGFDEMFKLLLEEGANVDILNSVGIAPLAYAARFGRVNHLNWLIEQGADPNNSGDQYRLSSLIGAAVNGNAEIGLALLEVGADINETDSVNQAAALHWAMFYGNNQFAKMLLDQGADYEMSVLNGSFTARTLASAYQNTELVEYIEQLEQQNNPLFGSWKIQEIHYQYTDTTYKVKMTVPGRLMVSGSQYSIMYNPYGSVRKSAQQLSSLTEEEMLYGFKTMVFNTGTYELEDSTFATQADMAKVAGFEGGKQYYRLNKIKDQVRLTMYDETYPNGQKPEWYNKLEILFILEKEG